MGMPADGEILGKLVERGGRARAARATNGCADFGAHLAAARIEHAIQKRGDAAARRRVMHGRTDDQPVADLHFIQRGIDEIVAEDAAAFAASGAAAAADAAANRLIANPQNFRFDAAFLDRAGDFAERGIGAAVLIGAPLSKRTFMTRFLPEDVLL